MCIAAQVFLSQEPVLEWIFGLVKTLKLGTMPVGVLLDWRKKRRWRRYNDLVACT